MDGYEDTVWRLQHDEDEHDDNYDCQESVVVVNVV